MDFFLFKTLHFLGTGTVDPHVHVHRFRISHFLCYQDLGLKQDLFQDKPAFWDLYFIPHPTPDFSLESTLSYKLNTLQSNY